MPALDITNPGVPVVLSVAKVLAEVLREPCLGQEPTTADLAPEKLSLTKFCNRVVASLTDHGATIEETETSSQESSKTRQFAIIETAARDIFDKLVETTSINAPDFLNMWKLLDFLSILSDQGQCDPALLFWLVEELLDSQTIAGCRKIFDYLESRREQITAKHFKQKALVILRTCNELLRRLSRAEDTAFCGRVFIFMFQSFPLGDRSSVNLRGEYHVENVTTFDSSPSSFETKMCLDEPQTDANKPSKDSKTGIKGVTFDAKNTQDISDSDSLYPLFWSLQESFSQPLKLFDPVYFNHFKSSLEATMKTFQTIIYEGSNPSKSTQISRQEPKRKRSEAGLDEGPELFNPKYLTSRDLFGLEISDLSFRRHILVQALIIIDFILSLSAGAKEKVAKINPLNKSVIYNDQLTEQNAKWATDMKASISGYLKRGFDGPYFYRTVETVLARDKNWVFWKMASCPPIQRDAVLSGIFNDCKGCIQRLATNKRLRTTPMGAVSMDFVRQDASGQAMNELQAMDRYQLPELDTFKRKIADDDFEIDMPTNASTKATAIAGKASKSWRALRAGARCKLMAFDKIDDSKSVGSVFEPLPVEDSAIDDDDYGPVDNQETPENREPVIICGSQRVGKSRLVDKLLSTRRGIFAPVVRHAARQAQEGETAGKSFHFVTTQEFNQLRDGDRLVEYGTRDGVNYGTSIRAVDTLVDSGRVPLIKLDIDAAQFAKGMGFSARYVLILPPNDTNMLKARLARSGLDDAAVQALVTQMLEQTSPAKVEGLFDKSIVLDDLDQAAETLSEYVYGRSSYKKQHVKEPTRHGVGQESGDVDMEDDEPVTKPVGEGKQQD
ncbi:hypothetical protein CDD82_5489 [Ophiocordyceps australis]|uniref:Guanylate kinase-like domain-containing protein n=1 Tax=Ophiocordyceps australis TaxID=1399860 RepID=A0A2C5Z058_9HYPO|nr:hypothetical protein CDD82_5489 [Ophiocordyceps australis]